LERPDVALILIVLAVLAAACGDAPDGAAYDVPGEGSEVLTVEVLNGTSRSGLARLGTRALRRAQIDVVFFGNTPNRDAELDSTRIIVRRGSRAVGERVRRALGVGTIVVERDTALWLDASVWLGSDFAPRLEFHP
jgi:hypothetical protein